MFGLNNVATLYSRIGQSGGKPAYAAQGTPFSCRCEPAYLNRASNQSVEEIADTLFFAKMMSISPGDRIVFDRRNYLVKEVQALRGFSTIHHLEILAKAENA